MMSLRGRGRARVRFRPLWLKKEVKDESVTEDGIQGAGEDGGSKRLGRMTPGRAWGHDGPEKLRNLVDKLRGGLGAGADGNQVDRRSGEAAEMARGSEIVVKTYEELKCRFLQFNNNLEHTFVNVKQFKYWPKQEIGKWIVKRVVSPFEFYLEHVFPTVEGETQRTEMNYHVWYPKMQTFYNNLANLKRVQVEDDPRLQIVGCCFVYGKVNKFGRKQWHRVRVYRENENGDVVIFYLDIGKMDIVKFERSKFCKLIQDFAQPAQLLQCFLYNVLPARTGHSNAVTWSADALAYFKNLMNGCGDFVGNEFSGIVMTVSQKKIKTGFPEVATILGVVLFPNDADKHVCSVNALMVEAKHADAGGVFGCCAHQLEFPNPEPVKTSKFNFKKFSDRHAGWVADKPANYFNPVKGSKAGSSKSSSRSGGSESSKSEYLDKSKANTMEKIPNFVKERIAPVVLSCFTGPNHIVVNMESEQFDLKAMEHAIGRLVRLDQPIKVFDIGRFITFPTEEVAGDGKLSCAWHRGVILSIPKDKPDCCTILAVDYGNLLDVEQKAIFPLSQFFFDIPSFALRVHLDTHGLVPVHELDEDTLGYTDEAKQDFCKYLLSWADENPVYYIFRPGNSRWIEMKSLTHEVVYSKDLETWVAPDRKLNLEECIMSSPEKIYHPMLSPLYRSLGVLISYTMDAGSSATWHFGDIHEDLYDSEYAINLERTVYPPTVYDDLEPHWILRNLEVIPLRTP